MSNSPIGVRKWTCLPSPFSCPSSGIYAIVNRNNNKVYIGSALRCDGRWRYHRSELENQEHGNRHLQRAFNKDRDALYIEVIEQIENPTKAFLLEREQFWMDFYQSYDSKKGYNIAPKAASCQGIKRDPEYVARVAAALRGRKMSPERLAIHLNRKRPTHWRSFTPEQKAEQSRRFKGRKMPPGTGEKISKALSANPYQKRAVLQFSLDGKFLRRFEQVQHAEEFLGQRGNIHAVCKGKRRQAYGFMWKYASDASENDKLKLPKRKRTKQKWQMELPMGLG